jgi:hypothetical protein
MGLFGASTVPDDVVSFGVRMITVGGGPGEYMQYQ